MSNPISTVFANRRSTMFHVAGITLVAASFLPSAFAGPKKSNVINQIEAPLAQSLGTTLNISPSATPNEYTVTTLTASVGAGAGKPLVGGGTVNFYDANAVPTLIGTAQASSAGIAIIKIVPGVGPHSYTATFQGNATNAATAASNVATVTVAPGASSPHVKYTSEGVASSANTSSTGTYDLSDLLVFLGNAAPTGTVQFNNTTPSPDVNLGTVANASFGNTTKTFESSPLSTGVMNILTATTGDFNEDGYPDLVYTNSLHSSISVSLNTAIAHNNQALTSASFGAPTTINVGNNPYTLTTGDFNGDGHLDLAIANISGNNVSILLGTGTGTFNPASTATVNVGASPFSLVAADFDGNGTLDLAVANLGGGTISILMGNGDGTFTPKLTPLVTGNVPDALAVGDFGNGHVDLVVANGNDSNVEVYLNDGHGIFSLGTTFAVGEFPASLAVGDFDHDGKNDIAVLNQDTPGSISILRGTGVGTFTKQLIDPAVGNYPYGLAIGDLLGNGHVDLATANYSDNSFTVLANDGSGNFTPSTFNDPVNYQGITDVVAADFNGDGRLDLALPNYAATTVNTLLGARTTTATLSSTTITGSGSQNVSATYVVGTNDPYATSTSAPLSLASAGIVTTLTGGHFGSTNINSGASVSLFATVTKVGSNPNPTGTLTFTDNGVFLCSASLGTSFGTTSGSCTTKLIKGSRNSTHPITVSWGGDTTYAPEIDANFVTFKIN